MEYKSREECLEEIILLYREKEKLNREIQDLKEEGNSLKESIKGLEVEVKYWRKFNTEDHASHPINPLYPGYPIYPQTPIYFQSPTYSTPIITCEDKNPMPYCENVRAAVSEFIKRG